MSKWDILMKKIISNVLYDFFEFDRISAETGIQLAEKRVDLVIKNLKKPKIFLSDGAWIKYLYNHRNAWILMEFKGPNQSLSLDMILLVIYYKLLFAISRRTWFHKVSAFLVGPRLAGNVKKKLEETTERYLKIIGEKAFYKIVNDKTLEIYAL